MTIQEIKDYMKRENITQIELSEKSKIPLQTIRKIFSGIVKNPRIDTMQAIEKALGLIEENKDNQNTEYLTEDEKQLLRAYRSLIPSMKEHLLSMAESLSIAEIARKKNNLA